MTELLQYTFFQNALLATLLLSIVCGMVGTYIVTRRMVFIAGGIAHASLGGVGICALLAAPPLLGASVFSLATGFSVKLLSRRFEVREDSAIAMLWAFGMSIGIMCSFLTPSFLPDLPNYIFGNILLTTRADLVFLAAIALFAILFFFFCKPQIIAIAFDSEFAQSIHLNVNLYKNVMMALIALSIVGILRSMGIVLAICMLSIPQITSGLFCKSFNGMMWTSMLFIILSSLVGLFCSYYLNVPSGAAIVFVAVVIYLLCYTIKRAFQSLIFSR